MAKKKTRTAASGQPVGGDNARMFAVLRLSVSLIEDRATELYLTDDRTLEDVLSTLASAYTTLMQIQPEVAKGHHGNGDDDCGRNCVMCNGVCVPEGFCPQGGR